MHILGCIMGYNKSKFELTLANGEAQTSAYQYYVTVCLSVPPTKQF